MGKLKISLITFLLPVFCVAQILRGKVLDSKTKKPIETASIYFDNTTIGTTTDENGSFSITYNDAVQSTLVISYLGYEKVFISDYQSLNTVIIGIS